MAPDGQSEEGLARDLGLVDVTMIGLGAMIGAGIFVLIGHAAGVAGPAVLAAFLFNGLIALLVGAAYAELAAAMPKAGGAYEWAMVALPPVAGLLAGWISWFAHTVACSLYALGFGSFTTELWSVWAGRLPLERGLLEKFFALAVVAVFALINLRSTASTGKAELAVTSAKILVLVGLCGFGVHTLLGRPEPLAPLQPFVPRGLVGVGVAMGLTFIAFEGYEIIAQSGEEVRDPGRNVPRAIFISIIAATLIYLAVGFVLLTGLQPSGGQSTWTYLGHLGELGIAEAAAQLVPHGRVVMLLAGMASTMSALNATIYSSSRVGFALGRDRQIPAVFGRSSEKTRTPHVSILFTACAVVLMAWALPVEDVAASADIMFLLLFGGVSYAVIVLRRSRPDMDRPFTMPGVPYTPWLAVAIGAGLAVTLFRLSPVAWYTAGGWLLAGGVLHYAYSRHHARERTT